MDSAIWSDAQALAYIASYADLRNALGIDPNAGRQHYAIAGASEGRSITFDPLGYVASYSDLRVVYGIDAVAATRHYIQWGASEGRAVTFDALAYIASYADLRTVYGTDTAAATNHYIQWGASEGRSVTFDPWNYLASYADLRAVYGSDTAAATRHYVQWGANEGRTSTFDAIGYIGSYADLTAVFGSNIAAATRHYVLTGAGEGRTVNGLIAGPRIIAMSDSAVIGDNITSDYTPTVEGRAASGSLVRVFVDSNYAGTTITGEDGAWSYNISSLSDGSHSISASVGNSTVLSTFLVIDTTDPDRPIAPNISIDSDTEQKGDGRTTITSPTLQGFAEAGGSAIVYIDGRRIATVNTDAAGAWTYQVEKALAAGDHQVYIRSIDKAGNTSDRSEVFTLRIQVPVRSATLTTGIDDIVTSNEGAIISATSTTLTANSTMPIPNPPWSQMTPGDRLVGGSGYDTLQLYGAGDFRVDRLGSFTGFEKVLVTNPIGSGEARVYLGAQDIALGMSQGSPIRVYLGSGKITAEDLPGGSITVTSAANWNDGNIIKGTAPTPSNPYAATISMTFGEGSIGPAQTYDLRTAALSRVYIQSNGNNAFLINSATIAGVSNWTAYTYAGSSSLRVTDAAIDLGTSSISGFRIVSSNVTGTTFTTSSSSTALQVQGGDGQDTLVLRGSSFTTDQRNTIFATSSIETITDASGTYTKQRSLISFVDQDTDANGEVFNFSIEPQSDNLEQKTYLDLGADLLYFGYEEPVEEHPSTTQYNEMHHAPGHENLLFVSDYFVPFA